MYGIAVYDSENVSNLTWPHEVRWYPGRDRGRQSQRRQQLSQAYVCVKTVQSNALHAAHAQNLLQNPTWCATGRQFPAKVGGHGLQSPSLPAPIKCGFWQIFKSPPEGARSQRLQPRWSRCPCQRWWARPPAASTAPSPANPSLWIRCKVSCIRSHHLLAR